MGRFASIFGASLVIALAILFALPSEFPVPEAPGAILVTGAGGSGIGHHVAKRLSHEYPDYVIYGLVRREAHAQQLKEMGVRPLLGDLTNETAVQEALATVTADGSALVGLFYAAGIPVPNVPIEYLDLTSMKALYEVNVFGLVSLLQAALPLLKQQTGARVVIMGSVTGLVTPSFMGADPSRAVDAVADAFRREVKHMNIAVSVIQAGFIESPVIEKTSLADQEWKEKVDVSALERDYPHLKDKDYQKQTPRMAPMTVVSNAVLDALFRPRPRIKYLCGTTPFVPVWLFVPLLNILPHSIIDLFDML